MCQHWYTKSKPAFLEAPMYYCVMGAVISYCHCYFVFKILSNIVLDLDNEDITNNIVTPS